MMNDGNGRLLGGMYNGRLPFVVVVVAEYPIVGNVTRSTNDFL